MATRILLRRDTAANWTTANPVLSVGEEGVETDTLRRKIGDGATAWVGLAYSGRPPTDLDTDIAAKVNDGTSATAAAVNARALAEVQTATAVAPTGAWNFSQTPTVAGVALGSGGGGGGGSVDGGSAAAVTNLIQLRRGTAAAWNLANPVLSSGETGVETDTDKFKIGDGVTAWSGLGYAGGSGGTTTDATSTIKGVVQLAGDLGGTAASPTVTGGAHHAHTSAQLPAATTGALGVVQLANALGGSSTAPTALGLASQAALTEFIQDTIGAAMVAGTGIAIAYDDVAATITVSNTGNTVTIAQMPANTLVFVVQNGDGSWPNRPTSRTDISCQWVRIVSGSANPAAATSPAVNGAYTNDTVVGV